ncbi:hypothetical protein WJ0W_002360 [Paenibacillus melissococcoides]|uniref:Tail fiber protein n=1 Tax=Paenibacillus melissococcoides TaxID=2912268 RepID=A0ABM9G0J1_9BACL|nr:hypothetical protein [Paenibacillus melissococcoides]CAH8245130.1 hypothetical protein WJ0W_002360 [Paenibacillus melissococcoides]CAH8710058.1 hypothetical protein WDD9_002442 [Paenibacillus melissococcoides]CAH8710827.1 hypothetical protein HTL2_002742 [Paenibacillus melissococcoides]
MPFNKELPEWKAAGIQPPESKRVKGWEVEDRPPADWLNWHMNRSYEALQELQEKAAEKDDVSKALKDAKEYTDQKAQAVTPESIGAETPTGAQEKADAALTVAKQYTDENINVLRADVDSNTDEIRNLKQSVDHVLGKPLGIKPGLQVVEVENDTPFQMGEIKGRTLINLLGRVGDCENTADWSAPGPGVKALSTERVYGSFSIEVASTKEEQAGFGIRSNGAVKDLDKYYIAVGYIRNISAQYVHLSFAEVKSEANVTSWFKSNGTVKSNQFTYAYVAVSPVDLAGKDRVEVYVRGVASEAGQKISADGIGLYEITEAEYNAIEGMTPEQVAKRYPYVDSMTNVTNPYAIVTGGNLLPPFYEWNGGTSGIFLEPYTQKVVSTGDRMNSATQMPAVEGKTYTLRIEREGDGEIGLDFRDDHNNVLWTSEFVKQDNIIATAPQGTAYMNAWTSAPAAGEFIFRNPMLTVGTKPKPFTPQQRSMLAFETELAAHPVNGSNPDTLFMRDDGLPYVLEKWRKISNFNDFGEYRISSNTSTTFKIVNVRNVDVNINHPTSFMTKYTGSPLEYSSTPVVTWTEPDFYRVSPANSGETETHLWVSISNTDSGWGPDYTPTQDEIRAYFYGYRLLKADGSLYDGNGQRYWNVINPDGSVAPGQYTTVLPTQPHSQWTPYRLQYLKAKPTVEPVRNYELGATLSGGSNMVEVGSGIVIREKTTPYGNYINAINAPGGRLQHRTTNLLAVYRFQTRDFGWTFKDNIWDGEPYQYAENPIPALANAIYHVTYTMLDPTLAAGISGTVAANLRGTVSDLVQDVGDIGRRLSVVETQKAEKDAPPPLRIKPTLLNGWVDYGSPFEHSFYYKDDSNVVSIEGLIGRGTAALGTSLFILPTGFRPDKSLIFPVLGWVTGVGEALVRIDVDPTGIVKIGSPNAKNDYLSLQGISFLANK